jgi:hypothetical protein
MRFDRAVATRAGATFEAQRIGIAAEIGRDARQAQRPPPAPHPRSALAQRHLDGDRLRARIERRVGVAGEEGIAVAQNGDAEIGVHRVLQRRSVGLVGAVARMLGVRPAQLEARRVGGRALRQAGIGVVDAEGEREIAAAVGDIEIVVAERIALVTEGLVVRQAVRRRCRHRRQQSFDRTIRAGATATRSASCGGTARLCAHRCQTDGDFDRTPQQEWGYPPPHFLFCPRASDCRSYCRPSPPRAYTGKASRFKCDLRSGGRRTAR